MQTLTTDGHAPVEQGARARAEALLLRYPDVAAAEAAEILRFLKKGAPLDVALVSADDRLRPQVERFRADYGSDFALGLRDWFKVAVLVAAVIAMCVLGWDAGAG